MQLPPELRGQIVEHALRDAPNECCGVIGLRDGVAVSVHPMENVTASPFRFEIDGLAMMHLHDDLEDNGLVPGGIYHSHTRSEPYPSQTDINFAAHWPEWEWLIVGVGGEEAVLRSYLIAGGVVTEVDVA